MDLQKAILHENEWDSPRNRKQTAIDPGLARADLHQYPQLFRNLGFRYHLLSLALYEAQLRLAIMKLGQLV